MKISPAIKGLITAAIMIIIVLVLYQTRQPANTPFAYAIYAVYALGIVWTLIDYKNSPAYTGKFSQNFSQAFRCFVVITLVMVVFTYVFDRMHPEFAEDYARSLREQLTKGKDTLPKDIDAMVADARKQYRTRLISTTIFGYLLIGTVVGAAASGLLTRRN